MSTLGKSKIIKTKIYILFSSACGGTSTLGNFAKATFQAICRTNDFLTPELWKDDTLGAPPFEEFSDYLEKNHKQGGIQRGEVKNYWTGYWNHFPVWYHPPFQTWS